MAETALGAVQWVVGKALAPVTDGLLVAWEASRNFGLNIEALRDELLLVKATLEIAGRKEIGGPAMDELLQRLQDSAHNAEDLLDELDYFRIHDELHNTHEAADKSGVQDLARDARHTTKAMGKQLKSLTAYCFGANTGHPRQEGTQHVSCCAWQRGRRRSPGDSFSAPNPNQEVSGCMPKLGKLFPGSSSPNPHVSGDEDCGNAQETPKLDFNRVDFSQRMKDIVEKLQPLRKDVNKILQGCGPRTVLDIAQHRPTTTPQSAEPKLYGRGRIMYSIIHDITEGQYCHKGLTVLPVVGPGGIGKTTLIQHIYHNQQVRNYFPVRIWICVSFNFNLDKVLEEIKRYTPAVASEEECIRTEELIERRLKSKKFLLVLDDIWQFTNVDDWNKLLLILRRSQGKGCMILVTTRFQAIARKVKTTDHPKELNGLEPEEFKKLFLVYVFDDEPCPRQKLHLLDKIMEKLKGSPLAAKTVGRLLRSDSSMSHWKRVLNSDEWETDNNGIISALKLSYDFLPFHLQRCFSYSALFPEDYRFRSHELISLWIGLEILTPCGQNPTFEGIGLSILNDLVIHGFFKEEETYEGMRYVMHDLLHELALKVASHDCLRFCLSDVGSVETKPSIRHLSISIENLGEYNAVSGQKLMRELKKLKTRLKVEHLQTLMLFGRMDEGFAKIFGEFFGEANALRVLYLPNMTYPVELMVQNFSRLVHLRFLRLGAWKKGEVHLPLSISKFYHLRVLDLEWYDGRDFPEDMSNLAKLCHYYAPTDDELHFNICYVGKLELLEKLKVFRVNRKSEGFEPKQLEHLTKLWELGIYNLEKIHTEDEAAQAKLIEKRCLRRLTLDWDSEQSSVEPGMEGVVLQNLQPHGDLQVLCIRGYGGPSCPTWLGDVWDLRELRLKNMARLKEFILGRSFCMLINLELVGLASLEKWVYPANGEKLPTDAHMFPLLQVLIIRECPKFLEFPISNHILYPDWFPKLQKLDIQDCPEFSSVISISWIESLHCVMMRCVKFLREFNFSKSSDGVKLKIEGNDVLDSLDQVLVFDKESCLEELTLERCPPLELKHLLMLTSLKKLIAKCSEAEAWMEEDKVTTTEEENRLKDAPMFPLLQVLIIRGWPKLLGLPFSNRLVCPNWFPKLQELMIQDCPEFSSVIPTSLIESLCRVIVEHVKLLEKFEYSKSSGGAELRIIGRGDLQSLDKVLDFDKETNLEKLTLEKCPPFELKQLLMLASLEKLTLEKCPPFELKHLLMLASRRTLIVRSSYCLVGPLGGQGDVELQLPVDCIGIDDLNGNSGEELTKLLTHFPRLSNLKICNCKNIKKLVVGVDVQQTTLEASEMGGGEIIAAAEEEDDGVLLFPAHLCDSLQELKLINCQELVPGGGWLHALRSLQRLTINHSPKFLSSSSSSRHIFPSSLQFLELTGVEGMGTLEPLSNLSSLTELAVCWCGEDLKCQGLQSLLTTGGHLKELKVLGSPGFFADWDPNPRRALEDVQGGEEQHRQLVSTLRELYTDDAAGLLSAPICTFLSSSLTNLELSGHVSEGMEHFSKEQEDALQLLSSLQELEFLCLPVLQQLPVGLHNLTNLKVLSICECPAVSSLPKDGLPKSLQELNVRRWFNQELEKQCRGLVGTIPTIRIGW